jgi:hypothetical protein
MYTEEGDATRLERNHDTGLDPNVLGTLLVRLSPDPSLVNFVTPPMAWASVCSDQAARTRLLSELPMLDDIDITARQRGDESQGV